MGTLVYVFTAEGYHKTTHLEMLKSAANNMDQYTKPLEAWPQPGWKPVRHAVTN